MLTVSNPRPLLRLSPRAVVPGLSQETDGACGSHAQDVLSIDSLLLLQGSRCVQIAHNGMTYKLQATKLGKLILTK